MATSGSLITAAEYNGLQARIANLLATGSSSYGYGQSINSTAISTVPPSNPDPTQGVITAAHWDALRLDITNIGIHQTGSLPNIADPAPGTLIGYGANYPMINYSTLLDTYTTNRFNIATSQTNISVKATAPTYTTKWYTEASCTATVTFPSAAVARHFFNSGGKIRFTTTRSGGTNNPQNSAWTNLLYSIGPQSLTGNTSVSSNFYTMTTTYQTVYQRSNSTPYSANYYKIEARTPGVANNSTGTATVVEFKVTLRDNYSGFTNPWVTVPEPGVDGNLVIVLDELKAANNSGDGTFNIDPLSTIVYSISSITAS